MSVWREEFPGGYQVPREIELMVKQGLVEDTSWKGDASPSFGAWLRDNRLLRLWVEHPNYARREGSAFRYTLLVQRGFTDPPEEWIVGTDDLEEVLEKLLWTIQERGREPRWRLLGPA